MKPFQCICGRLGAALTGLAVCVAGNALAQEQAVSASETLQLLEQGPNHQTFQRVVAQTNAPGRVTFQTNKIVCLESGMQRRQLDGAWQAASDEIELVDGHAEARKGRHHVTYQADIAHPDGAVKVNSADGKQIRTRCLGLAYYDWHKRQSVLVAELKSAVGELGDRFVYYPEAFTDVAMDIRYRNTKAGVEQDVVILERLPNPELFGFNPNTTWVELWTEFLDAPEPVVTQKIRPRWTKSTVDTLIDFGDLKIGQGMAFNLGQTPDKMIPVNKHWIKSPDGRRFLIEEVSWRSLTPFLRELPERAQAKIETRPGSQVNRVVQVRQWPEIQTASVRQAQPMRLAAAVPQTGLVLDYALNETEDDFVFRGDTTYHVTGNTSLTGSTVIEAGTVVKFDRNTELHLNGEVICQTEPYLPAYFTAKDDNSVGDILSGSTGNPSGYYADVALYLETAVTLQHVRIRHAAKAVLAAGSGAEGYALWHAQIAHCHTGIHAESANGAIYNILMCNLQRGFSGSWCHFTAQHLTANQMSLLTDDWDYQPDNGCGGAPSSSLDLLNSLITGCYGLGNMTVYQNHCSYLILNEGLYKSSGAGSHYLADCSIHRNAGITNNLADGLWNTLRQFTTEAPSLLTNLFTPDATLRPVVNRDGDAPDLGYHYAPLDYVVTNCVVSNSATLTLREGVTLAPVNGTGIRVKAGARLISVGTPQQPNRFVRYQAVQEYPVLLGSTDPNTTIPVSAWNDTGTLSSARFEFTEFVAGQRSGWHLYTTGTPYHCSELVVRHCGFRGGQVSFSGPANATVLLQNNWFDRVRTECRGTPALSAYNNLFERGSLYLNQSSGSCAWTIQENAFNGGLVTNASIVNLNHGYNAYLNSASRISPNTNTDLVVATFAFETGLLGDFYQPASSTLLNAGNRLASVAGLVPFTATTNQVADTQNVDIGFHYVALNASLRPVDTDTDGLANYLEDANGNGSCDTGETCANNADSDGDGVRDGQELIEGSNPLRDNPVTDNTLGLKVYTPLP